MLKEPKKPMQHAAHTIWFSDVLTSNLGRAGLSASPMQVGPARGWGIPVNTC